MKKGQNYYAVDIELPCVAALTGKSIGFVERGSLTRMNLLYTEMAIIVLSDQRSTAWVEGEVVRLRSKI